MLATLLTAALAIFLALVLVGVCLTPLALLSGVVAAWYARRQQAQTEHIEQLLAER
jgi:hypothetical protein